MPAGPAAVGSGSGASLQHTWNAITGNFLAQFSVPGGSPTPVFSYNSLGSTAQELYGQRIYLSWQPNPPAADAPAAPRPC